MALMIRVSDPVANARPRPRGIGLFPGFPKLEAAFIVTELVILLGGSLLFVHLSRELNRYADGRLLEPGASGGPAIILASPREICVGQQATPAQIEVHLRNALYVEGKNGSAVGTYRLADGGLEILPGPASFFRHSQTGESAAVVRFRDGRISSIRSIDGGASRQSYWLEPEVITTLGSDAPSERHLVRYQDLPPVLVDAVVAAEDHRFFSHHGVNLVRILEAAWADMQADSRVQGGSTLTMQLARNVFLSRRRIFRRKLEEIGLALFLESRLSKQQIFELYANRVYLGQNRNSSIYGFGDAAQAYFRKDIARINLPEAAFLAGVICAPNWYSPYKYPQRALQRRNYVLRQMTETGAITAAQGKRAMAAPLDAVPPSVSGSNQQGYFEDLVTEELRQHFSPRQINFGGLKIYTTLDLDLEQAASAASQIASTAVDLQIKQRTSPKVEARRKPFEPQIALVVLDPHTGEVKALIGGRDYGVSQLDHAEARRQPGSAFKPFVYAAALNSGIDGSQPLITPATILEDEPTQFEFGGDKFYAPRDYHEEYHGTVTVREALTDSLNVPTVGLARVVGFDKVRNLAIAAGFNSQLKATPSLALGAYVATPVEVSGAYTVFANGGQYVEPHCILQVDDASGANLWTEPVATRRVLDPRVTYLMVNLLQGVINGGTGWGVRARGFTLPAAGKTGTSHDGWFAGFTSNLLAVAWVGYDDDRDLNLSGADSALPLWTEFMKRATELPGYRNAVPFAVPDGVVSVPVATQTSAPDAPNVVTLTVRNEVFIRGTEPDVPGPGEPETAAAEAASAAQTPLDTGGQLIAAALTELPLEASAPPSSPAASAAAVAPPGPAQTLLSALFSPPPDGSPIGQLCIQTDPPGLEVFVDGKPVGASPLTITEPQGDHTYRVAPPPGEIPIVRTVQIQPAQRKTIDIHY